MGVESQEWCKPMRMELDSGMHSSQRLDAAAADSLRRRQRDRLAARGRGGKDVDITPDEEQRQPQRFHWSPIAAKETRSHASPPRRLAAQDDLDLGDKAARQGNGSTGTIMLDTNTDSMSGGRVARQFTVANVGNNGKIYLRPTVRTAAERQPQPTFVFPVTPPDTAPTEVFVAQISKDSQRDSQWTSTQTHTTPRTPSHLLDAHALPHVGTLQRPVSRRRAYSQSTVDDQHAALRDSDAGAFRIVIDRPGTARRPRTADELSGIPTLEVAIPSHRLGTPRFSARGTACIRGSSYAGTVTDDMRSSMNSYAPLDVCRDRNSLRPGTYIPRTSSYIMPQLQGFRLASSDALEPSSIPTPSVAGPRTIQPAMFEDLTFKPACDEKSVVRFTNTGTIAAATPPRVIAEITSPDFLDYDLLSDFFLTFRSFLTTADLLAMLMARFRWALARNDNVGMIVRVRTFVALRHWILNYFADDFVMDHSLRKSFCDMLNNYVDDIVANPRGEKNQLKIIGELKKCWRRTCALYWDGDESSASVPLEATIAPGGIAGSRGSGTNHDSWNCKTEVLPQSDQVAQLNRFDDATNKKAVEVSHETPDDFVRPYVRPESAVVHRLIEPPRSPQSMISEEYISCSLPAKFKAGLGSIKRPLGPRLVPVDTVRANASAIAFIRKPQLEMSSQVEKGMQRTSFRSFNDHESVRNVRAIVYKVEDTLVSNFFPGSLIHGSLCSPGNAFVEVVVPIRSSQQSRDIPRITVSSTKPKDEKGTPPTGVRKLIGSVRRAIAARSDGSVDSSPTSSSFARHNNTSDLVNVQDVSSRTQFKHLKARPVMRIDLLGAGAAEDFKRAVREDMEADAEVRRIGAERASIGVASGNEAMYPTLPSDEQIMAVGPSLQRAALSGITNGSKSIVIFDDTLPSMTSALPVNPSIETFSDAFINTAGPTPPITPVTQHTGNPRGSSYLLGHADVILENDTITSPASPKALIGEDETRTSHVISLQEKRRQAVKPSMHSFVYSLKSRRSASLRRCASLQSGLNRRTTENSFDATSASVTADSMSSIAPIEPPRMLRRRPGGDLRAATNNDELGYPLRRTKSTGSLTTQTESVQDSVVLALELSGCVGGPDHNSGIASFSRFSLGAMANVPSSRPRLSLLSDQVSRAAMRPSFEAEAAKLAQIPDDIDDDGGVESALMKLEGKFEDHGHSQSPHQGMSQALVLPDSVDVDRVEGSSLIALGDDSEHHALGGQGQATTSGTTMSTTATNVPHPASMIVPLQTRTYQPLLFNLPIQAPPQSPVSINSIPLLDRDFPEDCDDDRRVDSWQGTSVLRDASEERKPISRRKSALSYDSDVAILDDTGAMEEKSGLSSSDLGSHGGSFLDDDSDDESDVSSKSVVGGALQTEFEGMGQLPGSFPIQKGFRKPRAALPLHPLRLPSSPSMVTAQATESLSSYNPAPQVYLNQLQDTTDKALPPTPDASPVRADNEPASMAAFGNTTAPKHIEHGASGSSSKLSPHLPYILAFDSKVLAQQFTVIEKDALNEIDWKDLIDMRWKDSKMVTRSWVDFLRTQDVHGVAVVITRFNLMVKWAVSEVVLTSDIEERVQTIIKYIHIAAHCRKYRNFATSYQILLAMTDSNVSRLTKTWSRVPPSDIASLRQLETLCSPLRNFYNLRAEMEGSASDQPCIPFVGVYTQDLIFNAQRPTSVSSMPNEEPMVNFQKCRTQATIVKNLLRLLESSAKYTFVPVDGIVDRCLWMSSLGDDEMRRLSRELE